MSESPRRIVERFYEEIWNRQDPLAIDRLCDEDLVFRGSLGEERRGRRGFAEYVSIVTSALDDYRCDILDLVVENDRAFARMRFSGVQRGELLGFAPTHRRVEWAGAALFRVEEGTIRELWVLGDLNGLRAQLSPDFGKSRPERPET